MAYARVIPPDATVNPDIFPEQEFPLYCPDCDYSLRGLTHNRCPECGAPFERGRLLVEQYVIEGGKRLSKRTICYAKWMMIIGIVLFGAVLVFLLGIAPSLVKPARTSTQSTDLIFDMIRFTPAIAVLGGAMLFTSLCLSLRVAWIGRRRCRAVFEAIDRDTLRTVQRRRWVLLIPSLTVLMALFVWLARPGSDWFRYYAESPSRLVIPVALACGIGLILYLGERLWKRWTGSDNKRTT